jgi:hypothetical protein
MGFTETIIARDTVCEDRIVMEKRGTVAKEHPGYAS